MPQAKRRNTRREAGQRLGGLRMKNSLMRNSINPETALEVECAFTIACRRPDVYIRRDTTGTKRKQAQAEVHGLFSFFLTVTIVLLDGGMNQP